MARHNLHLVARELVQRAKASGKMEWSANDPELPQQAHRLDVKSYQITHFGRDLLVLKIPIDSKETIVVFPENESGGDEIGQVDGRLLWLGDGILLLRNISEKNVKTIDVPQGNIR